MEISIESVLSFIEFSSAVYSTQAPRSDRRLTCAGVLFLSLSSNATSAMSMFVLRFLPIPNRLSSPFSGKIFTQLARLHWGP